MKRAYLKISLCLIFPTVILCGLVFGATTGGLTVTVPGANSDITLNPENEHTHVDKPDKKTTEIKTTHPKCTIEPTSPETTEQSTTESQKCDDKLIALTFDDGPKTKNTAKILDILEKYNAKATFFVIGLHIDTNPNKNYELLRRAVEIGCEIGSHSYSHDRLIELTDEEIVGELDSMNSIVFEATENYPALFRAPFGDYDDRVKEIVDMPFIQWSIDTDDWKYKITADDERTAEEIDADKQKIIDSVINCAKDGDIVLMHDFYSITADACETIVSVLTDMDFKLVTVSEMMDLKGIEMQAGEVYKNAYDSQAS